MPFGPGACATVAGARIIIRLRARPETTLPEDGPRLKKTSNAAATTPCHRGHDDDRTGPSDDGPHHHPVQRPGGTQETERRGDPEEDDDGHQRRDKPDQAEQDAAWRGGGHLGELEAERAARQDDGQRDRAEERNIRRQQLGRHRSGDGAGQDAGPDQPDDIRHSRSLEDELAKCPHQEQAGDDHHVLGNALHVLPSSNPAASVPQGSSGRPARLPRALPLSA